MNEPSTEQEQYASLADLRQALERQAEDITFRLGVMLLAGLCASVAIIAAIR